MGISWWERFRKDAIDSLPFLLQDIRQKQIYQVEVPVFLLNKPRSSSKNSVIFDNNQQQCLLSEP